MRNHFGWVVEIDPYDAASTPRKRTALGRFGHEGCWPALVRRRPKPRLLHGRRLQNEYSTSSSPTPRGPRRTPGRPPPAIGDKYLDDGTLYVAQVQRRRHRATGSRWCSAQGRLTAANAAYAFADQADVLVNTRLAADAAGATKMDRPEWTAVNPKNGEVYVTLTNNTAARARSTRPTRPTRASTTTPRARRHATSAAIPTATSSVCAKTATRPSDHASTGTSTCSAPARTSMRQRQPLGPRATNDFSSPDGLWFCASNGGLIPAVDPDRRRRLHRRHQLHDARGVPGRSATAARRPSPTPMRRRHARPRRPSSARRRARTCAASWSARRTARSPASPTPDGRALFVNIQHPGEPRLPGDLPEQLAGEPVRPDKLAVRARRRSSSPAPTAAWWGFKLRHFPKGGAGAAACRRPPRSSFQANGETRSPSWSPRASRPRRGKRPAAISRSWR